VKSRITEQTLLVMDASTTQAVIGLVRDNQCLKQICWPSSRGNPGTLVANIQELCHTAAIPLEKLDAILVGCGPGQYAGLRVSVTVAQTLQLPAGGEVWGICSAYPLFEVARETHPHVSSLVVCGDARRNHIWLYQWNRDAEQQPPPDMQCLPIDALADIELPDNTLIASPDYERLHTRLQLPGNAQWIMGNQAPTVPAIMRLIQRHPLARTKPVIQYVHPPVASPLARPPQGSPGV